MSSLGLDPASAAKRVRGLAERGDPMCRDIFRVQAHALGLFFDEMINTFDPDALIVGGGAIETDARSNAGSSSEIRAGMPPQRRNRPTSRFTSCPTATPPAPAALQSRRSSSLGMGG